MFVWAAVSEVVPLEVIAVYGFGVDFDTIASLCTRHAVAALTASTGFSEAASESKQLLLGCCAPVRFAAGPSGLIC